MPHEIFMTWRSEIEAELTEARAALATAQAELRDAQTAAADAQIERLTLTNTMGRLEHGRPVATALARRQQQRDADLRSAEGALTRAKQKVANALSLISDLSDALAQLDHVAPLPAPADWPAPAAA